MEVKYKELQISDRIMDVVERALVMVEQAAPLKEADLGRLEKLTKVYTMLMSSTRENVKHNLFSKISDFAEIPEDSTDSSDET